MKWIDYANPTSLSDALGLMAEHKGRARALAGGTDILVQLRTGGKDPDLLVDVKEVPELNELTYSAGAGLIMGAAVPCYLIYADENVKSHYPAIMDVATLIGGTQIQGRASFGGNLCNSTPSADSIPAMIALGAICNIAGPGGTRQVPAEEFCTGPSKNVLAPDELLVSIAYPPPPPNFGANYIRFIPRNEMDIAVAGAGVSVELDNGTFKSARISLASVAPTPLFVREAGDALVGKPVNEESVQVAAEIARDAARPITDMRGTIEYRKHLCEVLTRRALNTAIERAKEAR
ncbi:MAG: xanthine dehydrogenase family protein subunit M [Chloroflexi bacterium]|nr:xanthine dehydrogenase family protein subunit M [Chloroflexota bacterium]